MNPNEMRYPPHFKVAGSKAHLAVFGAGVIASLSSPRRRNVIQAGGCAGMWPLALAPLFDQVYTFEADPTNFHCLLHNVRDVSNISAFNHALSDSRQLVSLSRPKLRAGAWQVDGAGALLKPRTATSEAEIAHDPIIQGIQAVTLDEFLGDVAVDALVLDVEGSELRALRGAERMITRHHPLLWMEFQHNHDELCAWLLAHGYDVPQWGIPPDVFSVWKGSASADSLAGASADSVLASSRLRYAIHPQPGNLTIGARP